MKKKSIHKPDNSKKEIESLLPPNLEFTDEFLDVLNKLENTNNNYFITGNAGTGKSTLLNFFRLQTSKNVIVLAPTGVAALNVRGQTIHSFFSFPLKILDERNLIITKKKRTIVNNLDMIIIDEVSMVRADILDAMDYTLKHLRASKLPFGGVQLVCFGDLFQLPPVVQTEVMSYFEEKYGSPYFFDSYSFNSAFFETIELTNIFRQKDDKFIGLLNAVRNNKATDNHLLELNKRLNRNAEIKNGQILIATVNNTVNRINEYKLKEIKEPEKSYFAQIEGGFESNVTPADINLTLKTGAQIMMLRNDMDKRWVNGSIGLLEKMTDDAVTVKIGDNSFEVEREDWEQIEYSFDRNELKVTENVVGIFRQFPIKLAWAITIHKSQGKTFDNLIIDLGNGAFASGQLYVALSRCRTLEGITLRQPVRPKDIIINERVVEFFRKL